jgi:hypothetical protein
VLEFLNKTTKPEIKSKDEEKFYQFAKALIAVPKKELDKELAKDEPTTSEHKKPR